jgi:hypothetical protein
MRSSLRNLVFPLLVMAGLAAAGYLTASVRVPDPVPDYALQAAAVYRLEVGAACFALLYLAAMTFLLALDGRGFAELGTHGLKVEQVVPAADDKQDENLSEQIKINQRLENDLNAGEKSMRSATKKLKALEKRVSILEAQTISSP